MLRQRRKAAAAPRPTEIVVARHGETIWNSERRMQGQKNSVLSDLGRAQARALGRRMRNEAFDVLYSSDLVRAYETAEAIRAETGREIIVDPRLRERAFGIFEGLTGPEMEAAYPGEYAKFRAKNPDYAVPGGESPRAFYDRTLACFVDLATRHPGERVVIVAHGLLLDTLYRASRGLDLVTSRKLELINASLNTFHHEAGNWRIVRWGDATHLEQVTVFSEGTTLP